MGETTGISWTDHTFSPWWGCVEVSPACDFCYAREWAHRMGHDVWGADASRRFFGAAHWNEPLRWNRSAAKAGVRRRVFCASMADIFERHPNADYNRNLNDERVRLWNLIASTPNLDWLLLTKRPQNMSDMVPDEWVLDGPPPNVWLGFTAEGQREFDVRWRHFVDWHHLATVIFVSYEPALGELLLPEDFLGRGQRAWAISGGESGRHARPSHPDWFRGVRDQCTAAGVPFHHKQWGEWCDYETAGANGWERTSKDNDGTMYGRLLDAPPHLSGRAWETRYPWTSADHPGPGPCMVRVGKKAAGRLLDGVEWAQFPEPR